MVLSAASVEAQQKVNKLQDSITEQRKKNDKLTRKQSQVAKLPRLDQPLSACCAMQMKEASAALEGCNEALQVELNEVLFAMSALNVDIWACWSQVRGSMEQLQKLQFGTPTKNRDSAATVLILFWHLVAVLTLC